VQSRVLLKIGLRPSLDHDVATIPGDRLEGEGRVTRKKKNVPSEIETQLIAAFRRRSPCTAARSCRLAFTCRGEAVPDPAREPIGRRLARDLSRRRARR
jgi:hypothetical protein